MKVNEKVLKTLLVFQFAVIFLFFIDENSLLAYSRFALGFLISFFSFRTLSMRGDNIAYSTLLIILFILGLISSFYNRNLGVIPYLYSLVAYGGTAMGLLTCPLSIKTSNRMYYVVCLFFGYHMVVGTNTNEILYYSRNFISIVLILFLGLVFISYNKEKKRVEYTPIIIGLIITLWSTGRSSIITFFLLLILKVFVDAFIIKGNVSEKRWFLIIVTLTFVVAFIIVPNREVFFSRFYMMNVEDEPRIVMWVDYFRHSVGNFFNFVFGANIKNVELVSVYDHLHNTFLTLHSRYGIVVFLYILSNIFISFIFLVKNRNYDLAIFMITFMLRSMTDNVLNGDILMLYFTFYTLYNTMSYYNYRTYGSSWVFRIN